MRKLIFFVLFLVTISKLAFGLEIKNTTNKTFILEAPDGSNIIIAPEHSALISEEIMSNFVLDSIAIANIYKIKNKNYPELIVFRVGDSKAEALFNISYSQSLRSELADYHRLTINFWDPSKEDDALLVNLEKKALIDLEDKLHAQTNFKCNIL